MSSFNLPSWTGIVCACAVVGIEWFILHWPAWLIASEYPCCGKKPGTLLTLFSLLPQVTILLISFFNSWSRSFWSGPPSYIYADGSMVLFSLVKAFTTLFQGEKEARELEKKVTGQVERLLKVFTLFSRSDS